MVDQLRQRPHVPSEKRWNPAQWAEQLERYVQELTERSSGPESALGEAAREISRAIAFGQDGQNGKARYALYESIGLLMLASDDGGVEFLNNVIDQMSP
jgi:hypothetical protein